MSIETVKQRWQEIEPIFDEALDLPTKQQIPFIVEKYKDDLSLIHTVIDLLKAQNGAPSFLSKPAMNLANSLLDYTSEEGQGHQDHVYNELADDIIGAYRLNREIGRGGMGVVYLAERIADDFDRQVAIKILMDKADKNYHLSRFKQEQEFLASLEHESIARIYDAGETEQGYPYFIMEYVEGLTIIQYCKTNQVDFHQCLALIQDIALAVNYAHQHLIIHRDLKASNIFVTREGKIKLLDFGIAKFLNHPKEFEITHGGAQPMTPSIAAPEQLTNKPVTVATDIYQLGLITYELLTGVTPDQLKCNSLAELVDEVCKKEWVLPSHVIDQNRVKHLDNSVKKKKLRKKLSGDIDNIILKMLEKEPKNRYASMEAVKYDIDAFIHHRPVRASNNSQWHIFAKFLQRHWRAASIASLIMVLTIAYGVTAHYQAEKIRQAYEISQQEQLKAKQVADFLANVFMAADPRINPLDKVDTKTLLLKGQEDIITRLSDAPEVQSYLLNIMGEIWIYYNDLEQTYNLLKTSRLNLEKNNLQEHSEYLKTTNLLSVYRGKKGELASALALSKKSLEGYIFLNKMNKKYDINDYVHALATNIWLLNMSGKFSQSIKKIDQALDIISSTEKIDPEQEALIYNALSNIQHSQGNFEQAISNLKKAMSLYKKRYGERHSYYTVLLTNLGNMLSDNEQFEEAEQLFKISLDIQNEVLGGDHVITANTVRSRGIAQYKQGHLLKAEETLQKDVLVRKRFFISDKIGLSFSELWLGMVKQDLGKYSEALTLYQNMLSVFKSQAAYGDILGRAITQLGMLSLAENNLQQAEQHFKEAIDVSNVKGMRITMAQLGYAEVLLRTNRGKQARYFAQAALERREESYKNSHIFVNEARLVYALALGKDEKSPQVLFLLNKSLTNLGNRNLPEHGHLNRIYKQGIRLRNSINAFGVD